jgi:hypothetical protein
MLFHHAEGEFTCMKINVPEVLVIRNNFVPYDADRLGR